VAGVAAMIFNFTRESHALILLLPFAYSLSFAALCVLLLRSTTTNWH